MQSLDKRRSGLTFQMTRDVLAVLISVVSFFISTISVYVNNLKAPDLVVITAPYVKQVVDDQSLNEAFFIPITAVNRGARPGTLLSFELTITYVASGEKQVLFGQYFTQGDSQSLIGPFFTPMTLNGYSSQSATICFYPVGQQTGNFLSRTGLYEFEIRSQTANVRGDSEKMVADQFQIVVDEEMSRVMQLQPDGEYVFPIPITAAR